MLVLRNKGKNKNDEVEKCVLDSRCFSDEN